MNLIIASISLDLISNDISCGSHISYFIDIIQSLVYDRNVNIICLQLIPCESLIVKKLANVLEWSYVSSPLNTDYYSATLYNPNLKLIENSAYNYNSWGMISCLSSNNKRVYIFNVGIKLPNQLMLDDINNMLVSSKYTFLAIGDFKKEQDINIWYNVQLKKWYMNVDATRSLMCCVPKSAIGGCNPAILINDKDEANCLSEFYYINNIIPVLICNYKV